MNKKHNVDFSAHKIIKRPTEVAFKTKNGTPVDFIANKPTKVPVRVHFRAKEKG